MQSLCSALSSQRGGREQIRIIIAFLRVGSREKLHRLALAPGLKDFPQKGSLAGMEIRTVIVKAYYDNRPMLNRLNVPRRSDAKKHPGNVDPRNFPFRAEVRFRDSSTDET